jgi:hypothetical protein
MHFLVHPVLTIIAHMRTLETGRLILRPGTPDDIENFEAFYRGMGPEGVPPTVEAVRAEAAFEALFRRHVTRVHRQAPVGKETEAEESEEDCSEAFLSRMAIKGGKP